MNKAELADRLLAAAEGRAKRHRVAFGPGADQGIRQFAQTAADKVLGDRSSLPPADPQVREAEAAFEKLVEEMVGAAGEIADYRKLHPDTIGEETLARALSRLCPLFPIC